jgi:soluble epoxide hydrolase / lipid-phosphate phosphatase
MALPKLEKKTKTVSRGFTYTYYTLPAHESKPTLMLFHGFPDTASLWTGLIDNFLLPNGYGVIAIDCLGYGGTSKPTDPASYAWPAMTADAIDILDAEKLDKVISVGHDWGSALAQRLYNYHPNRVSGLGTVNLAYIEPRDTPLDLKAFNEMTKKVFGYPQYEYWNFLTANDAPEIMRRNLESAYSVTHGDPRTFLEVWNVAGEFRKFVEDGKTQPTLPYAQGDHRTDFIDRLGRDGFDAPLCWYRATLTGVQSAADKQLPDSAKVVSVPTLFWGAEKDYLCRPEALQPVVAAGRLPNVKSVVRQGGHWALLEQPEVFGQDIVAWLKETF